ncbi:sensor histidine kinase [Mumia sp. ZJ1417]|uniref:sensor histidine kinase n=2 Tax=unclassified Mumia TaxID=2621872 RepID=UPI00141FBB84|nr:histidine kinase [Mumia sp. ZJ1417]QMW66656.1 sensor histidine kinase [Mumia sp. ZJ1417]
MRTAIMTPRRTDVLLCVSVAVVLAVVASSHEGRAGDVNPLAYLWAAGLGLLMLIRRSHPVLVLVLTTLGFFSYYAAGLPAIGVAVPIAAALYSAAEMGHLRAAIVTGTLTLGLSTAYRVATGQNVSLVVGYEFITHAALIAAAIALGHSVRVGRHLRRRTEQVSRLLTRQGELDQVVEGREERMRLARELHDSIGHSLSVASLYSVVAREAGDAKERDDAHELVRSSITDASSHLRRTVAVLRGSGRFEPDAGLDQVGRLGAAPTAAGYAVDVQVDPVDVAPEVGAAAFRLVQEAITNTLRHSNGRSISVRVRLREPGLLGVRVVDDGTAAVPPQIRPGHGLSGMRERVTDLGGTLEVDAGASGWVVEASIPTMPVTAGGAP